MNECNIDTRALARCTNGKQPTRPLGKLEMSCQDKSGMGVEGGQESNSQDCPAKIRTVGNYDICILRRLQERQTDSRAINYMYPEQ